MKTANQAGIARDWISLTDLLAGDHLRLVGLEQRDAAAAGRERRAAEGAPVSSIPVGNHGDNDLHPSERFSK